MVTVSDRRSNSKRVMLREVVQGYIEEFWDRSASNAVFVNKVRHFERTIEAQLLFDQIKLACPEKSLKFYPWITEFLSQELMPELLVFHNIAKKN